MVTSRWVAEHNTAMEHQDHGPPLEDGVAALPRHDERDALGIDGDPKRRALPQPPARGSGDDTQAQERRLRCGLLLVGRRRRGERGEKGQT